MATKKRTGLGRGIGALIPTTPSSEGRPVDVFFPSTPTSKDIDETSASAPAGAESREGTASKAAGGETSQPARTTRSRRAAAPKDGSASPAPRTSRKKSDTSTTKAAHEEAQREAEGPDTPSTEGLAPVPGATFTEIALSRIAPNLRQPRSEFDDDKLEELTTSVREFGVLQPIVVRPIRDEHPAAGSADYELIMGERRLRASKLAGLERIPAVVRETADDDMLRDALLENIHRAELNPLEEASAYQQLLDDFGTTQEELARRIGRSRPQISNTLRLLRLPIDVQRRVAAGVLSAGHARAILSVGEPAAMTQLADKIVNEDLSVRAAEAAAQRHSTRTTPRTAPRASAGGLTAYLEEAGELLGDRLNTRVKVTLRKTKGQIVIDFASVNDLNRILADLGVEGPR